jgi:ribonuclease PH
VQASAEGATFSREQFDEMHDLALKGINELVAAQNKAIV